MLKHNVLLVAQRKQRINRLKIATFKQALADLNIETDACRPTHTSSMLFELAQKFNLTAYDAAYLELAWREQLALATQDKALQQAAKDVGVRWFG